MNSTLKSFKRTTILSKGVPHDWTTDPGSQPLPPENLVGESSAADNLDPETPIMPFVDQSQFDQAIHTLRFSDSVAERVFAADTLGNIGSELATADLIASLFDQEREVNIAAAKALSTIGDPAVNLHSLDTFFSSNGQDDESTDDVEYWPGHAAKSIQVRGNQALMVVEPPPPYPSGSTVSDPRSEWASGSKTAKTSGREVHLEVTVDCFDDPDPEVRNAAALAVSRVALERSAEYFTRIMERATPERRGRIGRAMVGSGLTTEAIEMLNDKSRERVYNALGLLSLMAKAGEIQPLVQIIEEHSSTHIRRAAVKLLFLSGQPEMATTAVKRRLKI